MVVRPYQADIKRGPEDRQGHLPHPRVHDAAAGLYSRGPGDYRWKAAWPFHVALEDSYIRANYDTISELCKLNGIPSTLPASRYAVTGRGACRSSGSSSTP
jgi:hypothetical protein